MKGSRLNQLFLSHSLRRLKVQTKFLQILQQAMAIVAGRFAQAADIKQFPACFRRRFGRIGKQLTLAATAFHQTNPLVQQANPINPLAVVL